MNEPERVIQIGSERVRCWINAQFVDEIVTHQLREQRGSRDQMVNVLISEALAARRAVSKEVTDKKTRQQKGSTPCPPPTQPKT